jgi:hypothetical protein
MNITPCHLNAMTVAPGLRSHRPVDVTRATGADARTPIRAEGNRGER